MKKKEQKDSEKKAQAVAYPEIFFRGGSTNLVDRGQREQGSGGGSPPSQGFRQICKWVKPVFLLGS
jgi:hypothetical protein